MGLFQRKSSAVEEYYRLFIYIVVPIFFYGCAGTSYKYTKGFKPYPSPEKKGLKKNYKPKRIALVIGINKYKDPAWNPLRFAVKDALDVAKTIQEGPETKFDTVLIAISPEETTKKAIIQKLKLLQKLNRDPRDIVFVYISAHGTLARDSSLRLKRFLVTYDTISKRVAQTALPIELLRKIFGQLKSQKKVLILATCHSGAGKSRLTPEVRAELSTLKGSFFVKPIEQTSKATIVLGACGFGETARESPKLKNDIYTYYFLQAIQKKYDPNGDGAVSVSEAHDYAKEMTYYHTRGEQRPYAESDILGADPIILAGKKKGPGKPVLYAYKEKFYGVEVEVDGIPKGSLPRGIAVKPGKRKIRLLSPDKKKVLFEGDVYLKPGERVEIESLFKRKYFPLSLSLKGGYQFFIQGSTEDKLSNSLPLFGLDLFWHRPFAFPLSLKFELAFTRNSHTLEEQGNRPQTVTEFNIGISILYPYSIWNFTFYGGLRLSSIFLYRQSDLHVDVSDFFYSFQPGITAIVEYKILPRWSITMESRLNYTYVTVENGPPRHQGSYELFGGVLFNF